VVPPVPIPNTEVKRCSPDGSASIGCARVGHCQSYEPQVPKGIWGSFFPIIVLVVVLVLESGRGFEYGFENVDRSRTSFLSQRDWMKIAGHPAAAELPGLQLKNDPVRKIEATSSW
jgi:hypothetical protein